MKKILIAVLGAVVFSSASYADNFWGPPYHWARTTSSFDLTIINSTTSDWDYYVTSATSNWSTSSSVLNMIEVEGSTAKKTRRRCKGGSGKVRVCNLAYGWNGWLGIAGISIDSLNHITTGYTKFNDTYFSTSYYDNPEWKMSVACQELGHNVGLGHQDEDFYNQSLFSCMDYQVPPYEYPNAHDFQQLGSIYGHLDSYTTLPDAGSDPDSGSGGSCNAPPNKGCNKGESPGHNGDIGWGMSLGRRGQGETFIRVDPDGTRHITHVTWAIGY